MSILSIQDLTYRTYGPFSLEIAAGECVGLTGPSGMGKSLMLRALCDLDPHEGLVRLDDRACDMVSAPEWRCMVGLLPSESQWWYDTVGPHFDDEPDGEALNKLGFGPEVMQWNISRLSSGEKQRLSLLRLLRGKPHALLLDEPTANLDRANMGQVETMIAEYRRTHQAPVLWISHDIDQLRRVTSRLYMLRENQLVVASDQAAPPEVAS